MSKVSIEELPVPQAVRTMAVPTVIALAAIGIVLKAERLPLNIGAGIAAGMPAALSVRQTRRGFFQS